MRRPFLPVLAALGLLGGGFGLGLLVTDGGDRASDLGPAPVRSPAHRDEPAPALVGLPPSEGRPDAGDDLALERLRAAMDALPASVVPPGAGAIEGSVRTREGAGVGGAVVVLTPRPPDSPSQAGRDADPDPAASLLRYAKRMRWLRDAERRTTTTSDGAFRLDGLADSDHDVSVRLEGHRIESAPGTRRPVRPGQRADFLAIPVAEVEIDGRLPDGRAPEEMTVQFAGGASRHRFGWRPGNPAFSLEPGSYEVVAYAGPGDRYRSDPTSLRVEIGRRERVRLDLQGRAGIVGRVRFAEGEARSGFQVVVARLPDGAEADANALAVPLAQTEIRGDWTFSFLDLAPGRYAIGLRRNRMGTGAVECIRETNVGAGTTEAELEVPALRPEEYVVVRVADPQGKVPPGLRFGAGFYDEHSATASGGITSLPRETGVWWLVHSDLGDVGSGGTRWLEASAPGLGRRIVEYAPNRATDLTIRFDPPVSFGVSLHGIPAAYAGRMQALLQTPAGSGRGSVGSSPIQKPVPVNGTVRFEEVQPGAYDLLVGIADARDNSWPRRGVWRDRVAVSAEGGETRVEVPALHSVALLVADVGYLFVTRDGSDLPWQFHVQVPTGADRVAVDGLPPGDYTAHLGSRKTAFRVPGPDEVVLK